MIRDLQQKFAGRIKSDDAGEGGIGDVKDTLTFRNGDGGRELDSSQLAPALPFHFRAVVVAHAIRAGIGQAEVVVFVQGEAEGFGKSFIAFFRASKPAAEPGESRL